MMHSIKSALLCLLFGCLTLMACEPRQPQQSGNGHSEIDTIQTGQNQETDKAAMFAELNTVKDSIEKLKDRFTFIRQDLKGRSYYHKNWWGRYTIADKALLAGIDSMGSLFLISNYEGEKHIEHNRIKLMIAGQTYYTRLADSVTRFPVFHMRPAAFEVNTYDEDTGTCRLIAENYQQPIRFAFAGARDTISTSLDARDKAGIRDCYHLSNLLKKKAELEKRSKNW